VRENDAAPSYYGYGWAIFSNLDGSCRIAHDGSARIHVDVMGFFPEQDALLIAFNTQSRSYWRGFLQDPYYSALAGNEPAFPKVTRRPEAELARLAGDYRLVNGSLLPLRLQGGRLHLEPLSADVVRLFSPWPMLGTERIAALGDRQALISEVMNGIARREYAPLLARLRRDVKPEDEVQWWNDNWPEWEAKHGAYLGADLVGTVEITGSPSNPVDDNDRLRSLVLLRFTRGTVLLGFVHDPDERIYVDWMPQHVMRDVFLAPQLDGSFLTYSPNTGRSVRVRFQSDGGAQSMVVENEKETVTAVRSAPPG
jgi:hypothetical protein